MSYDITCNITDNNSVSPHSVARLGPEESELVWEKRHYLSEKPEALSRVLQAAHSWDWTSLAELYTMVKDWSPITPLQALELLLPRCVYIMYSYTGFT